MRNKVGLLLLFIFYGISVISQGVNSIWLLKNNKGLDFRVQPPLVFDIPFIFNNVENQAVSNKDGELLFYTNGDFVWNRNHERVPNGEGLSNNLSTLFPFSIAPVPSKNNEYYIFTTSLSSSLYSLNYSIFNKELDNGFGDIEIENRKVEILNGLLPHTDIIKNPCNSNYYWLVGIDEFGENLNFFKVTSQGISTPVIKNLGGNRVRRINLSIDYSRIAFKISINEILILEFDTNNASISNPVIINSKYNFEEYISFSDNNEFLYAVHNLGADKKIVQYDLRQWSSDMISNSDYVIYSNDLANISFLSMATGPDDKIYISWGGNNFLSKIDFPNNHREKASFIKDAINIEFYDGVYLPKKIVTLEDRAKYHLNDTTICSGEVLTQNVPSTQGNLMWSDGDTSRTKEIIDEGDYSYTVSTPEGCEYSDTFYVEVIPREEETIIQEICPGDSIELAGEWYQIGDNRVDTIDTDGCPGILTVQVVEYPPPFTTSLLPVDTTICEGDSVVVDLSSLEGVFQWSDDLVDPERIIYEAGSYIVTYTTMKGCMYTDTLNIQYLEESFIQLDTILCYGDELIIGQDTVMEAGIYQDTLTDESGCLMIKEIMIEIDSSSMIYDTTRISIPEDSGYEWNGRFYSTPGIYAYEMINNNGCEVIEYLDLQVERAIAPEVIFSNILSVNDDGINDELRIYRGSEEEYIVSTFQIYSRWGNIVHRQPGPIPIEDLTWDGKLNDEALPSGVYTYLMIYKRLDSPEEEIKTGTITLIR